ncbi:unnamed protein product [Phytophthora fragariaefolia]|uniref:Unnamed protein product n=1 Tax=Phytophthora fragariaefolia TaxID=1490495 RepID=A0A9W7CTE1_9STRA|nr:unnamed protein product [Phytophthora fragariaefolia]
METPCSAKRQVRADRAADNSKATENTRRGTGKSMRRRFQADDDSSSEEEGYDGDGGVQMNKYMRQIRELTDSEQSNATPRIEVATHRPLGQIKPFSGRRNKSENPMQWLRSFIYEMKETRAPPNEWCMPFELSLRDGALHWHIQLPKKTKRQWSALSEAFIKYYCSQFNQSVESRYYSAKREDKEHVCDYLNRFNGYAQNASIQFDNGGRKARDHVRRFLETCGDRGLERRLCHVRVRDIHELEEMITDILRIEERSTTRDNSHQHSRSRDHRREDRRHDDSRDNYYKKDRRDRDNERRRDDSRNTPRASLAEASIADMLAELHCRDGRTTLNEFASARGSDRGDRSSDAGSERGSDDSGRRTKNGATSYPQTRADDISPQPMKANAEPPLKVPMPAPITDNTGVTDSTATSIRILVPMTRPRQPFTTIWTLRCMRQPIPLRTFLQEALQIDQTSARCWQVRCRSRNRQPRPHLDGEEGLESRAPVSTLQRPFKLGSPPTETGLVPIGLPQLVAPAIEAGYIFAFVGKCEWPNDGDDISVNTTETK